MMSLQNGEDQKFCVWKVCETTYSVSLEHVVGLVSLKSELKADQTEISKNDLIETNLDFNTLKVIKDFNANNALKTSSKRLLLLKAKNHILATVIEDISMGQALDNRVQRITESDIIKYGSEHIYTSDQAEVSNSTTLTKDYKSYIFFEMGDQKCVIDITKVNRVLSPVQVNKFTLVSERALGYFYAEKETVPVVSFNKISLDCDKILVVNYKDYQIGFPVSKVCHILRNQALSLSEQTGQAQYEEELWSFIESNEMVKQIDYEEIHKGYQRVFPFKNSESLIAKASDSRALVMLDIGREVCVPATFIRQIAKPEADFSNQTKTFLFNSKEIPLVDARTHYQMPKNESAVDLERIVVLEIENTFFSIAVSAVKSVIYIDEGSIFSYGEWVFSESNANFKSDVSGLTFVSDYQHQNKLNLIFISLKSILTKIKLAA